MPAPVVWPFGEFGGPRAGNDSRALGVTGAVSSTNSLAEPSSWSRSSATAASARLSHTPPSTPGSPLLCDFGTVVFSSTATT